MINAATSSFPPTTGRRRHKRVGLIGDATHGPRWVLALIVVLGILPWGSGALEAQRRAIAADTMRPLASVFEGDDGGAYFVTEIEEHVYWLAEGRGYAHVFHGIRRSDRIDGEYWSVPSDDAAAQGAVRLRILGNGALEVVHKTGAFPTERLTVSTIQSLGSGLRPMTKPQRTGRDAGDLDGAFDGPNDLRIFVQQGREIRGRSQRLVFFGQNRFAGTRPARVPAPPAGRPIRTDARHVEPVDAPDAAWVFIGARSGDLVSGHLIPVPKGKLRAPRKAADRATIAMRVNPDRSLTVVEDYEVLGVGVLGQSRWTPVPMHVQHDVAAAFAGADGGLYFVSTIGAQVYWVAEGPGYAHVFHGARKANEIDGHYWSVPSGKATTHGMVRLQVLANGDLRVAEQTGGFPTRTLANTSIDAVRGKLLPETKPQFGSAPRDLDGAYDGPKGVRIYVREGNRTADGKTRVAIFGQSDYAGLRPPRPGEQRPAMAPTRTNATDGADRRPDLAFVFVGIRDGDAISGHLTPVPKGQLPAPKDEQHLAEFSLKRHADGSLSVVKDFTVLGQRVFGDGRWAPVVQAVERQVELLGHQAPLQVVTERVHEYEVIEGDILVGGGSGFRANAVADQGRLWPGGVLPFEIDASVSASTKASILAAIEHITTSTTNSNLQIKARNGERDYVVFVERELNGAGGFSFVGRVGSEGSGRQDLLVKPGAKAGIVIHELGHALGLFHEQARFDRDQYVEIVWANIEKGRETNFQRHVTDGMDFGPYDYASIMHYDEDSFSKDEVSKTILPKREGATIGQRNGLSALDIKAIAHLYPPTQSVPGLGARGNGADIAFTNLDADPRPEIVLMAYDESAGQNAFKYIVGFNVNADGFTSDWSDTPIVVDGLGEGANGAGMAIADLDGNGRPDIVLMAYDRGSPENVFKWKVGPDLDEHGWPTKPWRQRAFVRGVGALGDGADIEIADITRDGKLDIILMAYDAPDGMNAIKYMIGPSVDADGQVSPTAWIGPIKIDGLGHRGEGAGVLLANANDNRRKDLIFMVYDAAEGQNSFKFRIELDPTENGVSATGERWNYHGLGHHAEGAGIAAADLNHNGVPDLVVMAYDDPDDDPHTNNRFKYRVLRDALRP
jgi:hypothetical protein